ncbi:MAG TPA: hypothetical protein VKV28_13830 [Candidatus Binataceae bacterium]|nr:hypothetical protein [Candidatus Binataceae bacterium]
MMTSWNRLWQILSVLLVIGLCGCGMSDRQKAAADDAAIGFFAGGAVGCTAAGLVANRSSTAFGIGCPLGMVLGAVIGGTIGYVTYNAPPTSAVPGAMPPGAPPSTAAPMGGSAPSGPPPGH